MAFILRSRTPNRWRSGLRIEYRNVSGVRLAPSRLGNTCTRHVRIRGPAPAFAWRLADSVLVESASAFVIPRIPGAGTLLPIWSTKRVTAGRIRRRIGVVMKWAVAQGFRSSFRDWAAECTDAPREVCEFALAHVNSDRVEAAYRRSDLFDRRRC